MHELVALYLDYKPPAQRAMNAPNAEIDSFLGALPPGMSHASQADLAEFRLLQQQ